MSAFDVSSIKFLVLLWAIVTVEFAYDRYYIVNNKGTPAPAVPQKGLSQITNANNVSETTVNKAPN